MLTVFLLVSGLCVGSFLGALTSRYPKGDSITNGRSKCDECSQQIEWYDNIPILSFLLLSGKCRKCNKKISIRNPLIEIAGALGFVIIGLNIFYLLIFCILLSIFIIDFEYQIIPDDFVFFGIGITLIYIFLFRESTLYTSILAGFLASCFLLLIHIFTKGRGMGLGDVKFAVLGGMITGLNYVVPWLFVAFLTGAIVGIILIARGKAGLKDKIAFGPFLVIAIPISLIFGQNILNLFTIY
jgi:leader peptidase (prepilin peptidase)/N-methyltransferase